MQLSGAYLGIDLGTSGVKVVAADEDGAILAEHSTSLRVSRPQPGWSEQDPEEWWQATVAAIRALPAAIRRSIRGVGLSGQMHGAVLLDAADRVLRPAILWNDARSALECAELERAEPASREITGNLAMPGFTAPKLVWIRKHEPAIFSQVATVLLPKDTLRLRLTGERVSDMSDAAGTLWLDVARRDWSDGMLAATGLGRAQMPRLVEGTAVSGRVLKTIATELGIGEVPVAGGGGDNAASAVGSGVIEPGDGLLSLGTSGVLFVVTDRFRPNVERAVHAFCHALPERWHQMAVMLSAASALDWVARVGGFIDAPTAVAAAMERGPRTDTPMFLPYLTGERTPWNDPRARGVFFGLGIETTAADLVLSVLEGVAQGMSQGQQALLAAGGRLERLCAVGGGSRLRYWLELLASALAQPVVLRGGAEVGAALGAARLAQVACDGADPRMVCRPPPVHDEILPRADLTQWIESRRPAYVDLYWRLQPLFKEFPR